VSLLKVVCKCNFSYQKVRKCYESQFSFLLLYYTLLNHAQYDNVQVFKSV